MTYEKYKNSPLSWLPDAPEHWDFIKFKYLFKEINEKSSTGGEDLLSVSQYTGVTHRKDKIDEEKDHLTNAESLEGYKKVSVNDLVINIMLAWNGSLGFSPFEGIVSPAYCVYRVKEKALPKYFHYLLRTDFFKREFKKVSTGVIDSRLRMYTEDFFTLKTPVPPLAEQLAISNFLDEKLSEIDIFMQKKQQLINLLQERKAVFVNQILANTKGVIWKKLKFVSKILYGQSPHENTYNDKGVGSILINGPVEYSKTDFGYTRASKWTTDPKKFAPKESLLICLRGSTTGRLNICHDEVSIGRGVAAIIFRENQEFFTSVMMMLRKQIERDAQGTTFPSISSADLNNIKVPVLPLSIQAEIVSKIQIEHLEIDKAIATCRCEIDLVKEYREVLIAEAVTGKIKVTKS